MSEGSYLPHHRINKIQQWHRKAASQSLNTVAINVLYIDKVEDDAFSLYDLYGSTRTHTPGVMKFTILVDPSLVIVLYSQFV